VRAGALALLGLVSPFHGPRSVGESRAGATRTEPANSRPIRKVGRGDDRVYAAGTARPGGTSRAAGRSCPGGRASQKHLSRGAEHSRARAGQASRGRRRGAERCPARGGALAGAGRSIGRRGAEHRPAGGGASGGASAGARRSPGDTDPGRRLSWRRRRRAHRPELLADVHMLCTACAQPPPRGPSVTRLKAVVVFLAICGARSRRPPRPPLPTW
jgi:hypothetical protein